MTLIWWCYWSLQDTGCPLEEVSHSGFWLGDSHFCSLSWEGYGKRSYLKNKEGSTAPEFNRQSNSADHLERTYWGDDQRGSSELTSGLLL